MNIKWVKYTIIILVCAAWPLGGCGISAVPYVKEPEFAALNTKVDDLTGKVDYLVGKKGGGPSKANTPVAKNEKALYQQGQSLLKNKQYDAAATVFKKMLATTPQGDLAPNASYWLGECYYATGRYAEAAAEFKRCAASYPKSNKAPDALLKLSYSYDRLENGHQAMVVLEQLLAKYPNSNSANLIKNGRGQF